MMGRSPDEGTGTASRRSLRLIAILVTIIAVAAAGIVAMRFVRSPAQAAADTAPPPATVLTAPVENKIVRETVIGRGQVRAASSLTVPVPMAAEGTTALVVSATPVEAGKQLKAGDCLVELNGRPMIVLPGAVPAYRDLRPGAVGPDVSQLQRSLEALGLYAGPIDGSFGQGTKAAISALYARVGYPVASTTGVGNPPDPDVEAASDQVRSAERAVADTQEALSAAASTGSAAAPDSPTPPDTRDSAGPVNLDSSVTAVTRAREDLALARQKLAAAQQRSGPMLPASEVVFVSTLPARLASLPVHTGERLGAAPEVGAAPAPIATIDSGQLRVEVTLDAAVAQTVRKSMSANLIDEATGFRETGSIVEVTPSKAAGTNGTPQSIVTIKPAKPLPDAEAGADLRVTIDQASSKTKVLAVPIAAVTARADGSTFVTVVGTDGSQTRVDVTTGVTGAGSVQVTPVSGELSAGLKVVVGR